MQPKADGTLISLARINRLLCSFLGPNNWNEARGSRTTRYFLQQLKVETPLRWATIRLPSDRCVAATSLSYYESMEATKHKYIYLTTAPDTRCVVSGESSILSHKILDHLSSGKPVHNRCRVNAPLGIPHISVSTIESKLHIRSHELGPYLGPANTALNFGPLVPNTPT